MTQTELPDTLTQALAYASLGFAVHPRHSVVHRNDGTTWCTCGKQNIAADPADPDSKEEHPEAGKHPATQHGSKDATTDPDVIRSWDWSDRNIGLVLPDNVCAFDIDPRNAGDATWAEWTRGVELPPTPKAETGGGGLHFLFRTPPAGMKQRKGPGVDTPRAIVVAPSQHKSGGVYSWIVGPERPLADVPSFLLTKDEPKQAPRAMAPWSDEARAEYSEVESALLAVPPTLPRDQWLACIFAVWDALGGSREGAALVEDWSSGSPSQYRPGEATKIYNQTGPGEVRKATLFRLAMDHGWRPSGDARREEHRSRFDDVNIDGLMLGGAKRTPRVQFQTLAELAATPPASWLVRDLIPSTGLCVLAGDPGAGKTFLALDLALRVSCGLSEWMGRNIGDHGRVLYVALEGAGGLPSRVRAWCTAHGLDAAKHSGRIDTVRVWSESQPVMSAHGVSLLLEHIEAQAGSYRLIVIDTLTLAAGCDENDAGEMGKVLAQGHRLAAETGGCVLLLHHMRKPANGYRPSEHSMHDLRGSSATLGASDQVLAIRDAKRKGEPRRLSVLKSKDGPGIAPIGVRFDQFQTGWVRADGSPEDSIVPFPVELSASQAAAEAEAELAAQQKALVLAERVLARFEEVEEWESRRALRNKVTGNTTKVGDVISELVTFGYLETRLVRGKERIRRGPKYGEPVKLWPGTTGTTEEPRNHEGTTAPDRPRTDARIPAVGGGGVCPPYPPRNQEPRSSGPGPDASSGVAVPRNHGGTTEEPGTTADGSRPIQDGADGLAGLARPDIDDGMPTQPGGSRRRGKRT